MQPKLKRYQLSNAVRSASERELCESKWDNSRVYDTPNIFREGKRGQGNTGGIILNLN